MGSEKDAGPLTIAACEDSLQLTMGVALFPQDGISKDTAKDVDGCSQSQ